MSLSDHERYSGLLWATNQLVLLGEKTLAEPYTSQLWHAFLGKADKMYEEHNECEEEDSLKIYE